MGKNEKLFESCDEFSIGGIAAIFRELADEIERGVLVIEQSDSKVELTMPDKATFKVEIEEKLKGKSRQKKIEFEIEWFEKEKN